MQLSNAILIPKDTIKAKMCDVHVSNSQWIKPQFNQTNKNV